MHGVPARPWARQLADLHSRASKRGLRSGPSPLAEITEDALATGVAMLQELAQQHGECERLRVEAREQCAAWDHLFEIMPTACLITDDTGGIVEANRASGLLLNTSSKRLRGRPLTVYFEERTAFEELLRQIHGQAPVSTRLTVRPRERKRATVPVVVAPATTSNGDLKIWFLGSFGEVARDGSEWRNDSAGRAAGDSPDRSTDNSAFLCEQCGGFYTQAHGVTDCIADLQRQARALARRIEDLRQHATRSEEQSAVNQAISDRPGQELATGT